MENLPAPAQARSATDRSNHPERPVLDERLSAPSRPSTFRGELDEHKSLLEILYECQSKTSGTIAEIEEQLRDLSDTHHSFKDYAMTKLDHLEVKTAPMDLKIQDLEGYVTSCLDNAQPTQPANIRPSETQKQDESRGLAPGEQRPAFPHTQRPAQPPGLAEGSAPRGACPRP